MSMSSSRPEVPAAPARPQAKDRRVALLANLRTVHRGNDFPAFRFARSFAGDLSISPLTVRLNATIYT
jgi:hypothetical protein